MLESCYTNRDMAKYKITICEADTGIVLCEDGKRWLNDSGISMSQPEFETADAAISFKDMLLDRFPFSEVLIESGNDKNTNRDDIRLEVYLKERSAVWKWNALSRSARLFREKPICEVYKER